MFAQNAKRLLKLGIQGAGFLVLVLVLLTSSLHPQRERREETVDYYERWLERDVVYIVSEEERQVFQKPPEEKDSFIEQFWLRRGPNPTFAENEFKAEHCRRLAYANERFSSGIEGWATDRGRIYIRFGPPRSIDRNPTGECHMRSPGEGEGKRSIILTRSGTTTTWRESAQGSAWSIAGIPFSFKGQSPCFIWG